MSSPDWQPLEGRPPHERILRLLAYFDVFGHPLQANEIHRYAFGPAAPVSEIEATLTGLVSDGHIQQSDDLYFLPGREAGVPTRRDKALRARALWEEVPASVQLLASFPFVRGLSITGTLAKDAVGTDADIDYVVFAASGRVWLCRTVVALARRLMSHELRETCCTNVFLSEDKLAYDQETPYVAAEIGLSRPVFNPEIGQRFFDANPWLRSWFPGINTPPAPPLDVPDPTRPMTTRALERALGGRLGDRLEATLPIVWERFWAFKYGQLSDTERRRRFRVRPDLSTNHYNNFQARVLERYRDRLASLGLDEGSEAR